VTSIRENILKVKEAPEEVQESLEGLNKDLFELINENSEAVN